MQFLEFLGNYLLSGSADSNAILAFLITVILIFPAVFIFDYYIDINAKRKNGLKNKKKYVVK